MGADVFFVNYAKPQFAGNVGGIVLGYTYGTTLFENVSVTNSSIWGYGKIGILLGMGADPRREGHLQGLRFQEQHHPRRL